MTIQFICEKITHQLNFIESLRYRHRVLLPDLEFAETTSNLAQDWEQLSWQSLPYEQYWGQWNQNYAIRTHYQIPETWDLNSRIVLHLPLGNAKDAFEAHPEALIYIDGQTFTAVDARHSELVLPMDYKDHTPHHLHLHGWTGLGDSLFGDPRPHLYLNECSLAVVDEPTHQFCVLARIALDTAIQLPEEPLLGQSLLAILRQTLAAIDSRHPINDTFYDTVRLAYTSLQQALATLKHPDTMTVHAVGHAHIDTAWLWTLDITRGKAVRTFHTAIDLMNRYPNYHFVQSQPQLYDYAQQHFPDLFENIKQKVVAGQWEPIGGMWIEADCNVPSGESLARQFLYGQRYFLQHFGLTSRILWLPDTFGFSYTLPQIAKQAGIDYFFTTKLRWNEANELPHDTFIWRGLDGSELIAHFTPTPMQHWLRMPTYNADLNAQAAIETWERLHDKPTMRHALMAYGWGDGGGGPTPKMLDNLQILQDFVGVPNVKPTQAIDFFDTIETQYGDKLPIWDGGLYLETHQGTYTSQAWIKRANHQAEVLLHDIEYLAVWALLTDTTYDYPKNALDTGWIHVLLHQFHDILPGSSIKEVYDEARITYDTFTDTMSNVRHDALAIIAIQSSADVLLINTVGIVRDDLALWQDVHLADDEILVFNEQPVITQTTPYGTLIDLQSIKMPPHSILPLIRQSDKTSVPQDNLSITAIDNQFILDNGIIRAVFDASGALTQLYHCQTDDLCIVANGNQFQIFEDRPLRFDAWNIDPDFEDKQWFADAAHEIEIIETGRLRVTLKIVRRVMHSTITQHIRMTRNSARLDFETHIDWQERNMLLKVAFPMNFHPQDMYAGVQWGEKRIATHRNTSWETASYEQVFQGYIRLRSGKHSLALLSDCKYGFDYKADCLRLTLLKGATYPDPTADLGVHQFTYSLVASGYDDALQQTLALHHPVIVTAGTGTKSAMSQTLFATEGSPNVLIETIKRAEESNQIVLRLRETSGSQSETLLSALMPIQNAWISNILEEQKSSLDVLDNQVTLSLSAYQVLTVIVVLNEEA